MTWQGSTLPYCKNITEVGHTKPKGFFFSSQLWKLKSMVPEPASSQGMWSSQHRQLWWPACPAVEMRAEKSHEVPAKSKMELLCFVMILSQDAQSRSMRQELILSEQHTSLEASSPTRLYWTEAETQLLKPAAHTPCANLIMALCFH